MNGSIRVLLAVGVLTFGSLVATIPSVNQWATGPLHTEQDAQKQCPSVCQPYGGWSGKWFDKGPYSAKGVCICNKAG